ncbi:MAG TPA: penicillin-binding transpeptidase domain-containing protein [Bacillota bacterium]|nr:penicillin-binding transpeptidase domain-containing protein [Bacillota bacterium]
MFIVDHFTKRDPPLRVLRWLVAAGLSLLLAGLWWVQIVSSRDYQSSLETQSFRTVRIPAVRGQILDRNGAVLAESRPAHNLCLYLEEMRAAFAKEYARMRPVQIVTNHPLFWGAGSVKTQYLKLRKNQVQALTWAARCCVASNAAREVSQCLRQPIMLDPAKLQRHYATRLALPFPLLTDLTPAQIAVLEEQRPSRVGVDIDTQPIRVYPSGTTAAHLLGALRRDDSSLEGEEAFFSYRLPDFRGVVGVEAAYDKELRGLAGAKSVLVNNAGYRHTENVWTPAEPGNNVVLTIDLRIQEAAERALESVYGPTTRGAVVVMDVQSGDILALVSSPTLNPNHAIQGYPPGELQRRRDPNLRPEINRATQETYAPGSIFKMVVGLAALEAGLDPNELYQVAPNPARPGSGIIYVGQHPFHDTAKPGDYDFHRAFKKSSNAYFINRGMRAGIDRIVQLGQHLHFDETAGLGTRQEVPGVFPNAKRLTANWFDGDTANLCIGQGRIAVTPLHMAILTAAVANGGKVLRPRLVSRIDPQVASLEQPVVEFPAGRVRDNLGVQQRNLDILHAAMWADVAEADGTGHAAAVPGLEICGKTGTAEKKNERNQLLAYITWFTSFAPYRNPRYAVVVMVEEGASGGRTCAPVAKSIYAALLQEKLCKP